MKQTPRNGLVFGVLGLAFVTMPGCSGEDAGPPIGAGNFQATGGSGTAGTFGASGSGTTAGTGTGGSGAGGTFGTGGTATAGTGGTFGTGGTTAGAGGAGGASGGSTGGGGAGGAAGTAAGGGGAGGGANGDFPANCPAPTGAHGTTALTRSCWGAKANQCAATAQNMNPPVQAIDSVGESTRYSSGALMSTSQAFTFELDLGSEVMVNGVKVTSAAGTMDYAPQLQIALSKNGTEFTPVACGTGAVTTDFSFAATAARYVRLVQHGTADGWWSIHDLNVYASTGDTCLGGGTQMNTCTSPNTQ